MNLKSYLRGIGIGILVTSAIFIISGASDKGATMTDDMVIARAKELGMTEAATTVADVASPVSDTTQAVKPTIEVVEETGPVADAGDAKEDKATLTETVKDKPEATPEATPTKEPEPSKEPTPTKEAEPTKETAPTKEPTPEPAKEAEPTEKPTPTPKAEANGESFTITVNTGDGSDTVSRKLAQAGLVKDANDFDKFLISKGYDRKITTGNHVIPANATYDVIAQNLVSSTK